MDVIFNTSLIMDGLKNGAILAASSAVLSMALPMIMSAIGISEESSYKTLVDKLSSNIKDTSIYLIVLTVFTEIARALLGV